MTALDTIKSAVLGNPVNPNKQPSPTGVVKAFAEMQAQLEGAQAGALVFDTFAALTAVATVPSANIMAWVMTGTEAGIYQNTGTALAPVWTRRGSIPQFLVTGLNVGAGTVNAIQITTDLPVPTQDGRAMILVPILAINTAISPTVAINGGAALPIISNSGNDIAIGGLTAGMVIAGFVSAGKFRLISDQASAAVLAAAENFANIAQAAANNNLVFTTRSAAQAATVSATIHSLTLKGNATEIDGLGGYYVDTNNGSIDNFTSNAGARTWYRATDVAFSRLKTDVNYSVKLPSVKEPYQVRLIGNLPSKIPNYDDIIAMFGASAVYPQGITVDETAGHLYTIRAPTSGSSSRQWVDVYAFSKDAITGNYSVGAHVAGPFSAGEATSQGVAIVYQGATRYIAAVGASNKISFYDITTFPAALAILTAASSPLDDTRTTFTYRDGVFTTQNYGTTVGVYRSVYRFTRRKVDGTRVGAFAVSPLHSGVPAETLYQDFIPKQQSIAEGNGFFVGGIGGSYIPSNGETVKPYNYNGIRKYDISGEMEWEALCDPAKLLAFVQTNIRATANRVENEGVHVLRDGTIISLLMVNGAPSGIDGGMLFLEWCAKGENTLDLSSCAVQFSAGIDLSLYQHGTPPRDNGFYIDPLKNTVFPDLTAILRFMMVVELRRFVYHSTDGPATMIDGIVIPATCKVEIQNQNNLTFQTSARRVGFKYDVQLTSGANPWTDVFTSIQMPAQSAKLALAAASPFTFTATTMTKLPIAISAVGDERVRLDAANNRFIPYAGRYNVSATVMFTAGTTTGSPLRIYIYKNGTSGELISEASIDPRSAGDNSVSALPGIADFNGTTDYIEVFVQHSPAGTKTVSQSSGRTFLNIVQA